MQPAPDVFFTRQRLAVFLICFSAALVTIGARWKMIERDGSPVPYLDQWFGEGVELYEPAINATLSAANFLLPHTLRSQVAGENNP
jgi:hypothetical protein